MEPIYESINFDSRQMPAKAVNTCSGKNKLQQRLEAIEQQDNNSQGKQSDAYNFLNKCIPSPPHSSPPHDNNVDDDNDDLGPIQISTKTFDKLNKLYELRHYVRNPAIELNDLDDVVYRLNEFRDFSSRTQRGSSKTLCSFVSVNPFEFH